MSEAEELKPKHIYCEYRGCSDQIPYRNIIGTGMCEKHRLNKEMKQ